jgi:hypothetical protein
MSKVLFWILLLANVVIFAAIQWETLIWGKQVVAQPALHEEKMRLLDAAQIALAEKSSVPHAASAVNLTSMQLSLNMTSPVSNTVVVKSSAPICLEWGEFSGAELKLATTALSALGLGNKLNKRQVEHTIGYWVFIPPLKNKAAINKKIAQLKDDGVSEYFIVQETGAWQNAISLGVFKTQEAAQNFLNILRAKKIRSAKVGKRNSKLKVSIFMLNELDAATEIKLTAMQKDFAGSELKKVSCGLTR